MKWLIEYANDDAEMSTMFVICLVANLLVTANFVLLFLGLILTEVTFHVTQSAYAPLFVGQAVYFAIHLTLIFVCWVLNFATYSDNWRDPIVSYVKSRSVHHYPVSTGQVLMTFSTAAFIFVSIPAMIFYHFLLFGLVAIPFAVLLMVRSHYKAIREGKIQL